jgi:uncharacterized protein YjbJ (UPF0337 family)
VSGGGRAGRIHSPHIDIVLVPDGIGPLRLQETTTMDKDRVEGSAKQVKGTMKDAAGKLTGDAKLQAEGKADKAEGKIQNAVGGAKDSIRDAVNPKR